MARLGTLRPRIGSIDRRTAKPAPKEADPHYSSAEHRAWAAEVLRRAGGRCQGLGCGKVGVRLVADHVVERRDGGSDLDPANGQALCWSCHTRKTNAERAKRTARTE